MSGGVWAVVPTQETPWRGWTERERVREAVFYIALKGPNSSRVSVCTVLCVCVCVCVLHEKHKHFKGQWGMKEVELKSKRHQRKHVIGSHTRTHTVTLTRFTEFPSELDDIITPGIHCSVNSPIVVARGLNPANVVAMGLNQTM